MTREIFESYVRGEILHFEHDMFSHNVEYVYSNADTITIYKSLYQFLIDDYNDEYVSPLYDGTINECIEIIECKSGCYLIEDLYGFALDYKYDFEPFSISFLETFVTDYIAEIKYHTT